VPPSCMRILLVSDLHYSLPQFDWVVNACPSFDVVVIAGDCLDIKSPVPLDAQSVVILRYFAMIHASTCLVVSSGNHDLIGPDASGEQSALWLEEAREAGITTDGDSLEFEDSLLTACAWWDGSHGCASVAAQMAADSLRRPAHWLWAYHWPPLGSPTCWTGRRDYGDTKLGGWIDEYRPDFVLAGHVHQSPFTPGGSWADRIGETWVLNAGNQIGHVPARIEIDLGTNRATWFSLMGVEEVDLDDLLAPARTVF
jgi:Icc-related predicted phosphoesterase